MVTDNTCLFCNRDEAGSIATKSHSVAIFDGFPVSPGHALIIPKRHVASFFELSKEEQLDMLELLTEVRQFLIAKHKPDGFNIGINDGVTAGQTVMHLHIHLIPRYAGDVMDPRGGVRWIFPEKADYWTG